MRPKFWFFFVLPFFLLGSGRAEDAPSTGRVISAKLVQLEAPVGSAGIRGLRLFNPQKLVIEERESAGGSYDYFVRLAGELTAPEDTVLVLNRQDEVVKIPSGKLTQNFVARLKVVSERTEILLEALSINGKTQSIPLAVISQFEKTAGRKAQTFRGIFNPALSLGPSLIQHTESAAPPFSATALTLKGMLEWRLPGPWSVSGSLFVTALPISSSIEGLAPTFVGAGARVNALTRWLPAPWALSWSAGFYYISLFGVGDTYGFSNLHGPQPFPFPTLSRRLSSESVVTFNARYTPIWATFPNGLMDNTQAAVGLRYDRRPAGRSTGWFFSADYSRFDCRIQSVDITSSSLSVAGGILF